MEGIKNIEEFRKLVIDEINSVRTNPAKYATKIRGYMKHFKGKVLRLPGHTEGLMTKEGEAAFKDAAEFLEEAPKVKQLQYNAGLSHIAHDILKEQQKLEEVGEGNDIDIPAIIEKYGSYNGMFGQSIDYGSKTPEMVLMNILVDDGNPSREQRGQIFDTKLNEIGVATGSHGTYKQMTVLCFCTKFKTNSGVGDVEDEPKKEMKELTGKLKATKLKGKPKQDDDFEDLPEGVVKIDKQEKIIEEKGVKKKITKITKYMEDGSTQIETEKETI